MSDDVEIVDVKTVVKQQPDIKIPVPKFQQNENNIQNML
jgi:hypothetical protein